MKDTNLSAAQHAVIWAEIVLKIEKQFVAMRLGAEQQELTPELRIANAAFASYSKFCDAAAIDEAYKSLREINQEWP